MSWTVPSGPSDSALMVKSRRLRVGGEVAAEHDLGPPSVSLDILAQSRRLDRASVDDDRHRAMLDAGQSDLEARPLRAADHLVGRRGGREVEIDRRLTKRQIAHRAPDEPGLLALSVERFERSRERALPEQRQVLEPSVIETRKRVHLNRPGTRIPFSTCAGT